VTARFCLACGARLGTAEEGGRRRRRCPRCGWTHYANPVPATAAIVIEKGRLLLGRRARPPYAGAWDLPGGFLEARELPEPALRRELREEIGVAAARATLVDFASDRYGPGGVTVLIAVYRVRLRSTRVRPDDDVSELRWFPLAAIPYRRVAFPAIRGVLRGYLAGRYTARRGGSGSAPFERGPSGPRSSAGSGAARQARGRRRPGRAGSC
jgi:ADP-ribose pyrophosphatase YjhB (NUDIX family)